MHEDFVREPEHTGSSDRAFGLTFAVFFALVAILPLLHHKPLRLWAVGVSILFLLATAIPRVLRPMNLFWAKIGLLLSKITNPIITGLMFYLVFAPAAMVLRLLGKDLLHLKFDAAAGSYWIPRTPPGPAPESMQHQF
jgi:hypothetical protein